MPLSFQGKCTVVALPLVVDTPITKLLIWPCPHDNLCSLGLDELAPIVILYFCPLTACMPLQSIEQLTFLSSAGPHSWVFCCRMPPPLLRVQGCYSLQPGPRWGTNAHLRLHPIHRRQALGLPHFALVPPWTGSRLLLQLRTRSVLCSTFSFLWIFPVSYHSTAL